MVGEKAFLLTLHGKDPLSVQDKGLWCGNGRWTFCDADDDEDIVV